ncbi:MAG: peptide ABC transporter substrate-binding protein, partial [Bacillaceae bacterium]
MKKNRALKMFAVLSTSALLLTACNSDKEPANNKGKEEPKEAVKQVLTWPGAAELPSLDSSKSTDAESFVVLGNTIEGLYTLDSKEEATPAMAEKFETSADGKVITFHLRKDAKWSNGDPVTAKDFEYAWKRLLDPATKSEYAYIAYDVKNAQEVNEGKKKVDELGVKAVDDHTFEVTLNTAVPYFVKLTTFPSFFPLNEKFVKEKGEKYALEAENLLSNGPFMMTEWKHEQSYQLKKNPTYWDAKNVKLEEINFKIVKDASTSTNLYEAGQLDRAGLSAEFIDKYKDHKDKKINPDASIFFLRLNQKNPALANVNIRKAIDLAYDKEGISTVILNNGSTVANYLVPKGFVKDPSGVDFRDA